MPDIYCDSTTTNIVTVYSSSSLSYYCGFSAFRFRQNTGDHAIARFFGINSEEARYLFNGHRYSFPKSRRYVLRRLRAFLNKNENRINAARFRRMMQKVAGLADDSPFDMSTNRYCACGWCARDPWFNRQGFYL